MPGSRFTVATRVKLSFAQLSPWVPLSGWSVTLVVAVKVVVAAVMAAAG